MRNNGNQQRAYELRQDGASRREIAAAIGVSAVTVKKYISMERKKRAALGEPQDDIIKGPPETPKGMHSPLTTVQYRWDEDLQKYVIANEWRRYAPEVQHLEDFVDALCERVQGKGKVKVRKPKKTDSKDILAELDIFDPHVGMFAQEAYTLERNYNSDTAAKLMVEAAQNICGRFQSASEIVVVFGGDIMHMDNRSNKTEKSGNVLDVDTRYQRTIDYAVAACTTVVEIAAQHAASVRVVVTPGNHDWHSCLWLIRVLRAYYQKCKSVVIDEQQSPRKSLVWGDNLLVWTHGDGVRAARWPMIIAAEFAKQWGNTRHRYLMMGHVHHKKTIAPVMVEEQAGLVVEYLSALCPSDAWHSEAGFVGTQRGASGFEYHKKAGRISRFYYNSDL